MTTNILKNEISKALNGINDKSFLEAIYTIINTRLENYDYELTEADKNLLIAEAMQLVKTKLWKVLETDIKYQVNRKIYLLATTEIDLITGKIWAYTFDAFRTRLKSLAKQEGTFNK